MEMPQGNSQCSYLKQPKMSFFSSSSFSYTKSENRRVEQEGGIAPAWKGWYQ
jgi:hypothetical protein